MLDEDEQLGRSSSRRAILRKMGVGTIAGTTGISGLTGIGVGTSEESDFPNPEPDQVIQAPTYGFNSDTEWSSHRESAENSLQIAMNVNNPGGYPIDLCYTGENGEACVKDLGETFKIGKQPCTSCPTGHTPTVHYTSATLQDLTAGVSFDMWMGVDNNGCLWAGNETAGFAKTVSCNMPSQEYNRLDQPQDYESPIESAVTYVMNHKAETAIVVVGLATIAYGPGIVTALRIGGLAL